MSYLYSCWSTYNIPSSILWGFPGGSDGKESAWNSVDLGLIPGSGRSSGEGNGYQLQYSCLENSMDRGVWRGDIHTYFMFTLHTVFICALKKILQVNIKLIMLAFPRKRRGKWSCNGRVMVMGMMRTIVLLRLGCWGEHFRSGYLYRIWRHMVTGDMKKKSRSFELEEKK